MTTVEVKCSTLAEVAEKLAAFAVLGLRDVTVTSVPQPAADHLPAGFAYYVVGCDTDPRTATKDAT